MTVAVCTGCGSIKHGAFNPCQSCGVQPETETDLAYSLALTDHHFTLDVLREISNDMLRGAPRPSLLPQQESKMREAARAYIEQFGETLGLPPPTDPVIRRRAAKFRGWDKDIIRSSPVSRLMWMAGFGWVAVAVLAVPGITAILASGTARIIALSATFVIFLYNVYRWRRWNGRGWPAIHSRAMLLYAQIAGREAGLATQENREFSKVDACRFLALAMVSGNWKQASVDEMIDRLESLQGGYLADLIERFGTKVVPKLDKDTAALVTELLGRAEFGPQLIIANIIENTFGGEEATRYAMALARGKAQ